MVKLDAAELQTEIVEMLDREKHTVLATCSSDRVTARTVSYVNMGLTILFQTDKRFKKVDQILKNHNVALCIGNLQIEGTAELSGHPSEPYNAHFCSLYKQRHPDSFEKYLSIKSEIVIRVKPSLFILWRYIDGKPCRDYLIVIENTAYREFYEPAQPQNIPGLMM